MKKTNSLTGISILVLLVSSLAPVQTILAAEDVITIGYSGPLSGGGAQFGLNLKWGLELAADDINDMGGVNVAGKNHKVRIVSMDDQF